MYQYKKIKLPDGTTIDEHRFVWEEAYGPIPAGMVVHHKNGNKRDNRLLNLELLSYREHNIGHCSYKNFFTSGWYEKVCTANYLQFCKDKDGLYWCNSCKTLLPREKFSANKSRSSGLQNQCRSCRRKRSKK